MVVDYSFYSNRYGGAMPENSWRRYSLKAERRLSEYTFGRIPDEWPDEAKYAVCEMAEEIQEIEQRDGIASENNDGYSVSYRSDDNYESRLYGIALSYLSNTGLMNLGVEE